MEKNKLNGIKAFLKNILKKSKLWKNYHKKQNRKGNNMFISQDTYKTTTET